MKHFFFLSIFASLLFGQAFGTTTDTQLIDAISAQESEDALTADDLKFTTFQSCDEMTTVLEDYIKDNFKNNRNKRWYSMGIMENEMMFDDGVTVTNTVAAPQMAKMANAWWAAADGSNTATTTSSTTDFSTTNTQITGIDEADIIKSNGEYLYYYNQKEAKVQIIKTPLDIASSTLDVSRLEVLTNIKLPNSFNGIQLYIQDNNLVILSNRWRNNRNGGLLNNGQQVDVIVYDISNPSSPKLMRFTEIDGNYHDSRLIGDKLYIINQMWLDRYYPMQMRDDIDDIQLSDDEIHPKNIDIAYTTNNDKKNLKIEDTTFPYRVSVNTSDCNDIYYVLPTAQSIQEFGLHPSFTTVHVIDLWDTEVVPEVTTTFGSTQTIHMATNNLYLTDQIYVPGTSTFACPPNARCAMSVFGGGQQHSLIHKLNVAWSEVIYQDSTLINWAPLSQYSMDQWPEWNFRILTKTRQPELATHLSILDDDLDLIWSVPDIEPGEEFKSSRYIGDKLYLVTFEQTDPLFAIDMADPTDPEILGELVIPGFSTYLHPYGELIDGVQYLLWLGRETDLNERWGTVQEGIKLDLYKIDYNSKDADGHIAITQEYTKVRWENGSQSEAIYNPRMFVWDEDRNTLVLPMHLMSDEEWNEVCESERDPAGNIIREECRNNGRSQTDFIGMKAINITPTNGIMETHSFDYKELFAQDKDIYNNGRYNTRQLMPRVWYVGDMLYQLNGAFGHFVHLDGAATSEAYLTLGDHTITYPDLYWSESSGSTTGWSSGAEFEINAMNVTKCLANKWWTLYTAQDCRYCETQQEIFGEYFAKLDSVICDEGSEQQALCSDADVTAYPTWINAAGTEYKWFYDLESLASLAGC